MPETILVVEYEPRYIERVRMALSGQPFNTVFARDGEEAVRALDAASPSMIVLSSVIPKSSTSELIQTIRNREEGRETPILLTVSGYNGKTPKADAERVGATDILPKPYAESELLERIQQAIGGVVQAPQLTSNDIFGDLLDEEEKPARRSTRVTGDVDKMLADTLGGMLPQRKRETQTGTAAKGKSSAATELDRLLHDTLSGLEKPVRRTTGGGSTRVPPVPAAVPPDEAGTPAPALNRASGSDPSAEPKAAGSGTEAAPLVRPEASAIAEPAKADEEEAGADGSRFGQYVLLDRIATGGMAEVWKARMRGVEGFQKVVAIKKILPHLSDNQDFIEMFIDEAKLAAQLNHNNITHIYDLGKIQNSYYIAMEYVEGFDLKTILKRAADIGQPMTVELALFIASKIAAALDYAHRRRDFEEREMGLVHRDVSPQNVLISEEGDIKLCDFGIAKAATKASHTQTGALKGKLQYMSPEQAWGRAIDRRSDVFALATVLFEMLAGRKLFTGENELSILDQVREARVTAPSLFNDEVTPEIDRIVLKALQKDPADRYQTAGEMARDLDAILYSMRPTPTSADLAIYMHRLHGSEPEPVAPSLPFVEQVDTTPASNPFASSGFEIPAPLIPVPVIPAPVVPAPMLSVAPAPERAAIAPPLQSEPEAGEPERSSRLPLVLGVVLVLLAGGGGAAWFLMRAPAPPVGEPSHTQASVVPVAAAPAVEPAPGIVATEGTPLDQAAQPPQVDPSMVDREVQKLLAAERARLEAQARSPQQPTQSEPVAPRPAPVATAQIPEPVSVPAAQPAETRPSAPAVQQEPVTPVQSEPQPAQQAARTREGELVAAGTEGLTPPRVVRRGAVAYPPVARLQKVEGTVITSVLVSETGQVLEVKIIRGVNRPVGLNEAAEQAMRRSTFEPGTRDGVKVKAWITVPVEFKL